MRFGILLGIMVLLVGCGTNRTPGINTLRLDSTAWGDSGGVFSLGGTVTLPDTPPTGVATRLELSCTDSDPTIHGTQMGDGSITSTSKTISYQATQLVACAYTVRVRLDKDGNGSFGNPGDWEGYYDGTVDTPVQTPASATTITLSGTRSGLDFGIGAL